MEGAGRGLWYLHLAPVWGFILSLGLFDFLEGKNTVLFPADELGGALFMRPGQAGGRYGPAPTSEKITLA